MADLEVLLEVQARDTASDQLHHRKANLPERAELEQLRRDLATARAQMRRQDKEVEAAETKQAELEAEVAEADARISSIESRMFGGTVSASRELESMSEEVAALKTRRSGLEDAALEAMESAEAARVERDRLEEKEATLVAQVASAEERLGVAETALDALLASEQEARTSLAAGLPEELLATYERIRTKLGGVGVARLEGDRCMGCHLSLPSREVERLRHEPSDAVAYCDNCTRIVVR